MRRWDAGGWSGDIHRYTFRDCHRRARQMANALTSLGVKPSDRIGTLAWNGYRHLELYYGVSGMGAVLHTINPRLHEDQVAYIANHAVRRDSRCKRPGLHAGEG